MRVKRPRLGRGRRRQAGSGRRQRRVRASGGMGATHRASCDLQILACGGHGGQEAAEQHDCARHHACLRACRPGSHQQFRNKCRVD